MSYVVAREILSEFVTDSSSKDSADVLSVSQSYPEVEHVCLICKYPKGQLCRLTTPNQQRSIPKLIASGCLPDDFHVNDPRNLVFLCPNHERSFLNRRWALSPSLEDLHVSHQRFKESRAMDSREPFTPPKLNHPIEFVAIHPSERYIIVYPSKGNPAGEAKVFDSQEPNKNEDLIPTHPQLPPFERLDLDPFILVTRAHSHLNSEWGRVSDSTGDFAEPFRSAIDDLFDAWVGRM